MARFFISDAKYVLLFAFILLFSTFVNCNSVVVADSGSYVGTDTTSSGSSGGGGGGSGGGSTSGASWFYYSYKGDNEGESVKFLPIAAWNGDINSAVKINGACARKDGGFWHFGRTDGSGGSIDCYFRNGGPCGEIKDTFHYNMSVGSYYHSQTINHDIWKEDGQYWDYIKPKTSNVYHEIYGSKGDLKYEATEASTNPWSDENSKVLKAWKQSCIASGKSESDCGNIPYSVSYFCWWPGMAEVTLTAYAKYSTTDLNGGNPISSSTVSPGSKASVTSSGYEFPGYSWKEWGSKGVCKNAGSDRDCSVAISENTNVNAYYTKNQFYGRSRVMRDSEEKASTGYEQSNKQVIYTIGDCGNDGCKATIQHHLERTKGTGNTTYTIKRTTSNISGKGTGTIKKTTTETFKDADEIQELSTEYTLYPGQIVCETLIFEANIDNKSVKTTACVSANGKHVSDAGVGVLVKNADVTNYVNFQTGTIYAKPGDKVAFRGKYTPSGDQVYYDATPQKYSLNGGTLSSSDDKQLGDIKDLSWKNSFSLYISSPVDHEKSYNYNKGVTDEKNEDVESTLAAGSVGTKITGTAKLNDVDAVKNTPVKVEFGTSSETLSENSSETGVKTKYYTKANVVVSTSEASAAVVVPYNFINTTTVNTTNETTTFYAGETAEIKYSYIINPKTNAYTTNSADEKYATTVKNPKWKLELCVTGATSCSYTEEKTQASHDVSTTEMKSAKTYSKATTINVPDVPAGTEVCVRSGVYPASSGADTNYNNAEGDGQWAWSEPKCFVVAKKPSIQVWGGNIYSNGIIDTARAIKNNLAGYNDRGYTIENNSATAKTAFGSWGELGVVANGLVSGLASGASVGYGANNNGTLLPPLEGIVALSGTVPAGGSTKTDYCKQVPLSFANSKCTSGYTGQLGSAITSSSIKGDQSSILTKFDYGGTMNSDGVTALNDGNKIQKETYYYYGKKLIVGNQTNAGGNPVGRGSIQFVHGTEGVYINGNIEYQDGYAKLTDVPKLIVYTEGNINIACNVSRIDAILIAGGTVNTCADENGTSPDVNAAERSRQLIINGAVIATKLEAKRTYGAGPGVNSGVPAEILNFDPTLYRFGEIQSSNEDAGESFETTTNLDTVYQKELAPRA